MPEEMTASESAYGLMAWLTTRDQPVTLSAKHNAAPAADLVKEWCETNCLPEPREGVYPENVTMPQET
jgi:hypothetical protein